MIGEVTANETDALNMVFFDGGLGLLAADPHRSPSGLIGSTNCSIAFVTKNSSAAGGADLNFTDAQRMESVHAYISVLRRVGEALNKKSIVPIFSLAIPFDPIKAAHRGYPGAESTGAVITEAAVANALENVTWMRYYEWFQSNGWYAHRLNPFFSFCWWVLLLWKLAAVRA